MSLLSNVGQGLSDLAHSQARMTPTGVTVGELMVDPSNDHGHQGDNDTFILNKDHLNFQLFRSHDSLTFIRGTDDVASYWGPSPHSGGNETIYDFGTRATLRFSELETADIKVYGFGNDPFGKVVLYNPTTPPAIRPDGAGGSFLNNIHFIGATIAPEQVSVAHTATPPSQGGLI